MSRRIIVIGLSIIVILVAIVAMNWLSGDQSATTTIDYEVNFYTDKISARIDSMASLGWKPAEYHNSLFIIKNYGSSDLITKNAETALIENLNVLYTKQLKDVAYQFCTSTSSINKITEIEDEVKKFDKLYPDRLEDIKSWLPSLKSAFKRSSEATWYAHNSERSETAHLKYLAEFKKLEKEPIIRNKYLFDKDNGKVILAKSKLLRQKWVSDRYNKCYSKFRAMVENEVVFKLDSAELVTARDNVINFANSCSCDNINEDFNNKFYRSRCDDLYEETVSRLNRIDMRIANGTNN